jgi:phosphatidylglycerophosphate synthase
MDNLIESFKKTRKHLAINLPVTPSQISGLSVYASLFVIYNPIAAILAATLLDLLDGAVARAKKLESKEGELMDWAADRMSEYIIFGYFAWKISPIILLLPIANTAINMQILRGKKIYIMSIRSALLLYLLLATYLYPGLIH